MHALNQYQMIESSFLLGWLLTSTEPFPTSLCSLVKHLYIKHLYMCLSLVSETILNVFNSLIQRLVPVLQREGCNGRYKQSHVPYHGTWS